MKAFRLSVYIIIMQASLSACHTLQTEGPQGYQRHTNQTKYVETENIQWNDIDEQHQELSDEI